MRQNFKTIPKIIDLIRQPKTEYQKDWSNKNVFEREKLGNVLWIGKS